MTRAQSEMMARLTRAGFAWDDADILRRASMTLHRWAERECGDDRGAITRDDDTGLCYWESAWGGRPVRVRDLETGALRRVSRVMARYPGWVSYHQEDPRGAALYVIRRADLNPERPVDTQYTRGIAIF